MRRTTDPSAPKLERLTRIAKRIGVPYTSLRDAHFRGQLAIVRIGRAWYVCPGEVDAWIAMRTEKRAFTEAR
jgi:hypothetical protein